MSYQGHPASTLQGLTSACNVQRILALFAVTIIPHCMSLGGYSMDMLGQGEKDLL
jgi:hypothetical protein